MASWIDENKGEGPWAFVKQETKLGYLNNPYWTEEPASNNSHSPCGYWIKGIGTSAFQVNAFQPSAFQESLY